jgi:hypothetical protein
MGGQRKAPAAVPPGKTRYPLYRRLCGPQGRSEPVRKISPPPGFDPRPARSESRGMEVEEKIKIRGGIEAGRRISDVVSAKSRTPFSLCKNGICPK